MDFLNKVFYLLLILAAWFLMSINHVWATLYETEYIIPLDPVTLRKYKSISQLVLLPQNVGSKKTPMQLFSAKP